MLLFVFLLMTGLMVCAQNKIVMVTNDSLAGGITFEKYHTDRSAVELQCRKLVTQLMNKGFLTASVDSIRYWQDTAFVEIYSGKLYQWGQIRYKYLPKGMVDQFGFNRSLFGPANMDALQKSMTLTIRHFENLGYPFAYFFWDSLHIEQDTIHGILHFEKNILITFDTMALYGDPGLSKSFLYNYLNFTPGQKYDERIVTGMNDKLSRLPFATLQSKPQIYFIDRKAIVVISLKKRKTDRLDGLIGFAPNTGIPGNTKLLVTGEFHLDFKNVRGSGKGFKADWQSFQARSQTLNAGLNLPYLLNQPVGADVSVDFLKYDTLYTETRFNIGLHYLFSGLNNFRLFYEQKNTNLQYIDTFVIRQNKKLGDFTAMRTNRYGAELNVNNFDNPLSPRKGYLSILNASVFKRSILRDERINRVRFYDAQNKSYYTVYDSAKLVSFQMLIQYTLAKAWLLRKNVVFFNEVRGFHFFSPQIYFNELYRFGGNNTFRGFNEQSMFGSSVSIINLEVRYLLSENSFLKVFGNGAYYNDKSNRPGKISEDFPVGFGGGINLETAGGIFNISVALGKSKYIPIDFKNAKVHFGLINYF